MKENLALLTAESRESGKNLDSLEKYRAYIENLYDVKGSMKRKEFVNKTGWKDFVPVVDDDAARFLQLILQMKKPKHILEIGTSIGYRNFLHLRNRILHMFNYSTHKGAA